MAAIYTLGALYDFLHEKLTDFRKDDGRLDVNGLAEAAGTSDKALYKAFKQGRLTPNIAGKIAKASGGKVTPTDLVPFVFA